MNATGRRKCEGGCGRWLTSPASVSLGYGRKCAEKFAGTLSGGRTGVAGPRLPPGPSERLTATNAPPHCDGQDELPLTDELTLWSP